MLSYYVDFFFNFSILHYVMSYEKIFCDIHIYIIQYIYIYIYVYIYTVLYHIKLLYNINVISFNILYCTMFSYLTFHYIL